MFTISVFYFWPPQNPYLQWNPCQTGFDFLPFEFIFSVRTEKKHSMAMPTLVIIKCQIPPPDPYKSLCLLVIPELISQKHCHSMSGLIFSVRTEKNKAWLWHQLMILVSSGGSPYLAPRPWKINRNGRKVEFILSV